MSMLIEVWGDYACFSRPEMKTERVSYGAIVRFCNKNARLERR